MIKRLKVYAICVYLFYFLLNYLTGLYVLCLLFLSGFILQLINRNKPNGLGISKKGKILLFCSAFIYESTNSKFWWLIPVYYR